MEKYIHDAMAIRRFVLKTVTRLFIMVVVIAAVFMITQTPIITGDLGS